MKEKCTWIRARSAEQKEQRIQEIVSATERLFKNSNYEEITFVQIAKEAEFTRSNLYRYFKSKEEIFLEFLKADVQIWKEDLFINFISEKYYSINDFSEIWVETLLNNKRLISLFSILYEHLEKHAAYQSLLNFKNSFNEDFIQIVDHLKMCLENSTSEKISTFLNLQAALSIGLYQMTDISSTQKKILELPEFAHFRTDIRESLFYGIKLILSGLVKI